MDDRSRLMIWVTRPYVRASEVLLAVSLIAGVCLSFVCTAQAQDIDFVPVGMCEYKRLNRSEFIAELSVPKTLADRDDDLANRLMRSNTPAQMKMIITAPRLSARYFVNRWIEGMAVNNRASLLEQEKAPIQAFASAFKGRLLKGDRVVIARYNNDLRVSVNGIPILNAASPKGFSLFLSTWIGEVPLSTTFREEILGKTRFDELSARAKNLPLLPQRKDAVRAWLEDGREDETAQPFTPGVTQEEPDLDTESVFPSDVPASTQPFIPPSAQSQDDDIEEPSVVDVPEEGVPPSSVIEDTAEPPEKISNPAAVEAKGITGKSPPAESVPKQATKLVRPPSVSPQPTRPPVQTTPKESSQPSQEEPRPANNRLEYQQYYARMSKLVNVHRNLPRSALVRRISGEVKVAVTLDRSGKVLSQSLVSPSRHRVLNKQAMEAIALASPFDPVPASIVGDNVVFDVLVVYPKYW